MRSCFPSPKRCRSKPPSMVEISCLDFARPGDTVFRSLFCVFAPLREPLAFADARSIDPLLLTRGPPCLLVDRVLLACLPSPASAFGLPCDFFMQVCPRASPPLF